MSFFYRLLAKGSQLVVSSTSMGSLVTISAKAIRTCMVFWASNLLRMLSMKTYLCNST